MIYLIFLICLLLTIFLEGVIILFLFRRPIYVYYSVLCNLLTNPALNLVLSVSIYLWGARVYYPVLVLCEVIVIIIEAIVYSYLCRLRFSKSIALSFLLNGVSCVSGVILNIIFQSYF